MQPSCVQSDRGGREVSLQGEWLSSDHRRRVKMDICAQHCKGSLCGEEKEGCFSALQFSLWTATSVAGRLVAHAGILQAIWPYSGHYLPTEDNFKEFITFLEEHKVDLTNVKRCSIDDDGGLSSVIGSAFTALKKEMTRCYET